ncbi:hypothetical protein [Williamsia deligens]|uniref:Uncharacterized protein n=1 Tax=Williamsia deligens TaxID=321325 RepID=A0ABW3G646_9NOCA|nr:hypothetical protein [Williamsia deligens]MCP2193374.1 hypothetical protein [Williamsia deligens]
MDDESTLTRRIAQISEQYPQRDALAFDADGKLMDWREGGDDDWANGSLAGERLIEVPGGADETAVQEIIDRG